MRVGNPRVVPSTFVAVAVPPLSSTRLLIAKSCLEFHIESSNDSLGLKTLFVALHYFEIT